MKAVVYREYGGPEVLRVEDVETPAPGPDELLIRVAATTVSTAEMAMRSGRPFFARVVSGLRKPKRATIPGSELAGEVAAVGANVTAFTVGDRVVASTGAGLGANAELSRVAADGAVVRIPDGASYEDTVAVCAGGLTALPFLRDAGRIAPGERVLINGASGAVGTAAVQLAKHLGAHVTGVSGAVSAGLVASLGADEVIDYAQTDFTTTGQRYDIVFDVAGKSSFSRCRASLTPGGRYLRTVPSLAILAQMPVTSHVGSRRAIVMFTGLRKPADKARDLAFLMGLLDSGRIRAVIGRRFRLEESVEAHQFVEGDGKQGSVVLTVGTARQAQV